MLTIRTYFTRPPVNGSHAGIVSVFTPGTLQPSQSLCHSGIGKGEEWLAVRDSGHSVRDSLLRTRDILLGTVC
ncbi:hypothetical protein BaRGS_00028459 [Batillaria attramentaria]|uniref:Uncharacterized protein n=1 Tax=Batillaria attramentaria TaxID=370345 RepID=A0ABD0JYY1_9CAEN